jgi:KDO2-lipid IV(A) lauroyltransferase
MVISLVRNLVSFGYIIDGKYINMAIENILMAKPPVVRTHNEANQLALKTFEYFALSFIHLLYVNRLTNLRNKKYILFEGLETLDKRLGEKRGVILISAHLGNWEIGVAELALKGYPVHFVAYQQVNPYLNKLMNRFREGCGVNIIPTKGAIARSEELLKKGKIIIMLIDQTGREQGVEAEFFGRMAPAMWGPANLHLKTNAPIIPFVAYFLPQRTQKFHYNIKFGNEIALLPIGNKDEDIKRLTQLYLNEIERLIRARPEQWIWFHRRWKKY